MHRILLPIITLLLFFGGTLQAQMIADITQDVRTEFGVYHPYLVTITPNAEPYTVAPDFSNVVNFSDFNFTEVEKSLLAQNYFVVSPRREKGGTGYKEIYDIYNECREQDIPIFVTTDALLHTFHLLYDYVLKTVELKLLVADLNHLNKALLTIAEEQYQVATDSTVKEAAWRSVALLSIATVLLDTTFTVPTYVNSIVSAELALIKAQAGYSTSPLLGYPEDYSQYKVRGHYTTEEVLKPYFRSMMWLGRATLAVEGHPEVVRRHTRSALLLVQALERHLLLTAGTGVWDRIYLPTVFFVGKTDDLNYYHYKSLAHQVYGENFTYLPVGAFADTVALDQFIALAKELPGPRILTFTPKGFRLMGQRFIPDSYVTGKVVSSGRPMPRGLDPMVVLGSARACQILDQVFHDTGHFGILDSLAIEFKSMPDTVWAQNLYWNWLYCLMPLLFPKGEGYPPFMQNLAWVDKELYAALASWAELRHDTILYAKSSVTMGVHPESALLQGYVEPNPYFFARLAALTSYMLDGLSKQDLLFSEFDWRLRELEQLLLSLKTIAEKELTNHNLTGEEYELICNIGETIEKLVTTSGYGLEGPRYDSTDEMPVIADVHTDPVFTNCILEEGVGYPFNIFVICNVAGELVLTRGAGFSYYEFCQPIASGRLTDEEWKVMLKSDSPPEPPLWV
ncbi:MAG: DUF3160 domain-containing protein, partial [candidate division KSB1 bacterium]|nr:DUF3160 domain-containing protein [candidate division KSB1 bacterium]